MSSAQRSVRRSLVLLLLFVALWSGVAAPDALFSQTANPGTVSTEAKVSGAILVNQREPLKGLFTGGAPESVEGFRSLAAAGVRTFIDLRSDGESSEESRAAIAAAGLIYERLPITGEADLDLPKARALQALLADRTGYPVALACGSGNRAAALLAVEAFWLEGTSAPEALALGQSAGLTKLEPSVRQLLGLPPAALEPPKP